MMRRFCVNEKGMIDTKIIKLAKANGACNQISKGRSNFTKSVAMMTLYTPLCAIIIAAICISVRKNNSVELNQENVKIL